MNDNWADQSIGLLNRMKTEPMESSAAIVSAIAALVYAQLESAEQQRIANLLALANSKWMNSEVGDTVELSRLAAFEFIDYIFIDPDDEMPRLHPTIAQALRIKDA